MSIGPIGFQLWNTWPPYATSAPVGATWWGPRTGWAWLAAATTSLKVDPGGATAWVTCSSMGEPGAPARAFRAPAASGGPKTLLSNDGALAMARICPDRGSIATAPPILPVGRGCARTAAARL